MVAKGMVPKIVERMQLPPIEEKPLINIISTKNPLFGLKAPIGLDKSKILDDQHMGITIFSDSSKRS